MPHTIKVLAPLVNSITSLGLFLAAFDYDCAGEAVKQERGVVGKFE